MRQGWLLLVVGLTSSCITPRSMTLGMTAAPVGRGAAEVAVFGGVLYGSQLTPATTDPSAGQVSTRVFGAPAAEANVQVGFTERLALNVHASPAGLQPGLKWTLTRGKAVHVALLPAVGIGYWSSGSTTVVRDGSGVQRETDPRSVTSFVFLGGLKVLVSHHGGFFAGVGYDFLYHRSFSGEDATASRDRTQSLTETLAHQVSASVGIDVKLGLVHIRPEVAFAVYPAIGQTFTSRVGPAEMSTTGTGGFGWAILPGFSVAVASPRAAPVEEDRATRRAPRRKSDPYDDEDDDEDDQGGARRARPPDDDEDDPLEERPGRRDADPDDRRRRRPPPPEEVDERSRTRGDDEDDLF